MKEPLYRLRINFTPDLNDDGDPIQTAETIEIWRRDGAIYIRDRCSSLTTFLWKAPLGCPIVGDWAISVSRAGTIDINPPQFDDEEDL